MRLSINAAQKGLITGLLMIGLSIVLYYIHKTYDNPLQYLIYVIYFLGILWTLFSFLKSTHNKNKFGNFFLEGFKAFVVVTLLLVLFTFIFNKIHPEFKEQLGYEYKKDLLSQGNKTLPEIDEAVTKMKAYYLTILVSRTIFAYLFLGAVITAATSLIFLRRK